ncbi:hypothetical protein AT959_14085 [Dechloromonas denitrificans]|uniref:Uncharacterized protein n=1 Tax=Dechloromonas denitrificans TaxID=281362 RepID=A0A133XHN3_9RHOO|nr:hypothetical protein AT959_14085 [Dechloromonas denitrificans]
MLGTRCGLLEFPPSSIEIGQRKPGISITSVQTGSRLEVSQGIVQLAEVLRRHAPQTVMPRQSTFSLDHLVQYFFCPSPVALCHIGTTQGTGDIRIIGLKRNCSLQLRDPLFDKANPATGLSQAFFVFCRPGGKGYCMFKQGQGGLVIANSKGEIPQTEPCPMIFRLCRNDCLKKTPSLFIITRFHGDLGQAQLVHPPLFHKCHVSENDIAQV